MFLSFSRTRFVAILLLSLGLLLPAFSQEEVAQEGIEERVQRLEEQNALLMAELREMRELLVDKKEEANANAQAAAPQPAATPEIAAAPAPKVAPAPPRDPAPQTAAISEEEEGVASGFPGPTAPAVVEPPATIEERMAEIEKNSWKTQLNPNGGGLQFASPDEYFRFRLLAYIQAQATFTDGANDNSFEDGDFRVRRARVDFLADIGENYQFLLELDGAGASGTALVEARLNARLLDDALQLRLGKFTTPFSTENFRTSRAIDTVERYIALNAAFSLPALDVQNGAMLWGTMPVGTESEGFAPSITYYAGIYNGNSSAGSNGNVRDSNGDKEFQAKLVYQPTAEWTLGVGFDHNTSEEQALNLASLSGTSYISLPVVGTRNGVSADFLYQKDRFSLRGEGLAIDFKDADLSLYGGFLQAAYFVTGDEGGGFQPIVRVETAQLSGDALLGTNGDSISAVTAGFNWFLSGNVRWQLNYIGEYFDGTGNASVGAEGYRSSVLSQFQIKF